MRVRIGKGVGLLLVSVAVLVGACRSGPPADGAARRIRFPQAVPDTHPRMLKTREFAAAVAERTGGRLTVQAFPGGELYGAREAVRSAALGDVEMALEPQTHFITFDQAFRGLDVPFHFTSADAFQTFVHARVEPLVAPSLEKSGLVLLACWDEGPMILAGRSALLRTPEAFRGVKVRSSGHDLLAESWNALGATTVNIPVHEVYTALQQGVAQAIFTTFNTFVSGKSYEVAPKVVRWPARGVYVWVVNKAFWDGLSAEDRAIIREAADETTAAYNVAIWSNYDALVATVRAAPGGDFHELTTSEIDAFTARLQPMLDRWNREFAYLFADPAGAGS
jgi:TRAP-type C4-dicarboxylate transport system substrate-binding protein